MVRVPGESNFRDECEAKIKRSKCNRCKVPVEVRRNTRLCENCRDCGGESIMLGTCKDWKPRKLNNKEVLSK